MILRNKKTGEIVVFGEGIVDLTKIGCKNVAEMMEAGWEDYKESKEFWFVDSGGEVEETTYLTENDKANLANFGNYFETKEEAEKAVEKLKAWKRLKDKGFEFTDYDLFSGSSVKEKTEGEFAIIAECSDFVDNKDLDLLFGSEE